MRKILVLMLSLFVSFWPFFVNADTVQVTLSSGDILELSATMPALFEINQITNGVIISMKGGTFLTVTSLSTKELFVQPGGYGSGKTCVKGASSVVVSVPSSVPIADVTVLLGNNKCGVSLTLTPTPSQTPTPSASAMPTLTESQEPGSTGNAIPNTQQGQNGSGILYPTQTAQPGEDSASGPIRGNIFGNIINDSSILNTIIATLGTIATLSTLLAVYLAEVGQIFQTFETFKFWLLYILGLRKKRPWGIVFNKYLAKPVPGVVVEVFDVEYKKLRDTQLTDKDGRFMFVLDRGDYFIKFKKDGFESFQSQDIRVDDPSQPVFLNIEIIPERFYDLKSSAVGASRKYLSRIRDALVKINPFILLLGTSLTIYNINIDPSNYNYGVLVLYIIFDCIQLYYLVHSTRPFGIVLDSANSSPVDLAVVRLFDHQRQMLLYTKATDIYGRFSFLVPRGEYYLTVFKSGFSDYHSDVISARHGDVIQTDIKLIKSQAT